MAIGERIHFIRSLRGMTQKYLGMMVGFSEKTADVRMAQYETGARTPKADLTAELARVLDVSPKALDVPEIDSYVGLMHTLFALERSTAKFACGWISQKDRLIFNYLICFIPGGNKPLSWSAGRSAKRNTTAGATSIRSSINPGGGPKCPLKLCPTRRLKN